MTALTVLLLFLSLVGLVLVGLLYARLREVERTLQLKRHRSKDEALCDLLNYAASAAPGAVIGKNSVLIAGWESTAEDHASSTEPQPHGASLRIHQALWRLATGWTLHARS